VGEGERRRGEDRGKDEDQEKCVVRGGEFILFGKQAL